MTQARTLPAAASQFFSKETLQSFQNAFNAFDEDFDERNPRELLGKLFRAVGYLPRPEEVSDMIEDCPSELITFEDFVFYLYYHARSANPKRELFNAFRLFDRDGTGRLPVDTVRDILRSFKNPLSETEIEELIAMADLDSNDDVVYDSFVDKLLNF
jgi:Ca2+-binding EF-hand superfamily protein